MPAAGMASLACAVPACGLSLAGSLGKSEGGPDPLDAQLESSDDANANDAGTDDATSDSALGAPLDALADVGPDTGTCPGGMVLCVWCLVATSTVTKSTCEPIATAPCLDNNGTKPIGADYCPCADPSPAACPGPDLVCAGTGGGAHGCRPCGGGGTDNKACKAFGTCDDKSFTCK